MSDLNKNQDHNKDEDPNGKTFLQESLNESDQKTLTTDSNHTNSNPLKIEINFKAVGNAPILKRRKFLLERSKNIKFIVEWLKKYMKLEPKDQIFLYVNQEFAPSPDADIGTIYDCFKTGNSVIFYYCITPAWG
uniref:Ubiquitin-like protein ATG12 n=1 Tax=Brachionus rotundiformis TaxID=96890 RepID=A0A2Z4EU88_9BILA|nr:autophagy-related protein 12 [Brachionus rotundiformis]